MSDGTFEERLRVDGAIAVVTGASTRPGIGHSLACLLAEHGARHVAIVDINEKGGESTCADVQALGSSSSLILASVTSEDEMNGAVRQLTRTAGRIDILANCAGNQTATDFLGLERGELETVLASHLTGTLVCCEAVLPGMIAQGSGCIVNIASVAGRRGGGWIGKAPYATAKAGVQGLTKALAKELMSDGIRVNAVNPGLTDTGRVASLKEDGGALWAQLSGSLPIKRAARPEEIAAAMLFLVSNAASYIIGETVNVDGGFMLE